MAPREGEAYVSTSVAIIIQSREAPCLDDPPMPVTRKKS